MLADRVRIGAGEKWSWGEYRNLALDGRASASSINSAANTPDKAIDGGSPTDNDSRWISSGTDSNPWWEVDLGQTSLIDRIDIYSGHGSGTSLAIPIYTFQYWSGSDWVDIISVTDNNQNFRTHTISKIRTNKIRLIFPNQTGYQRVYEVEIYGQVRMGSGKPTFVGENLILNSADLSQINIYGVTGTVSIEDLNSSPTGQVWHLSSIVRTSGNYTLLFRLNDLAPKMNKVGREYTLSFLVKTNSNQILSVGLAGASIIEIINENITNDYKKVEIIFRLTSTTFTNNAHIFLAGDNLRDIYVYGLKLEEGTKATRWSPAPSD